MEKDLERDNAGNMRVPITGEICEEVVEDNYVFVVTDDVRANVMKWAKSEDAVVPQHIRNKILQEIEANNP